MNRIYRIIWNGTTGSWVVASELAGGRRRKTSKALKAALTVAAMAAAGTGWAAAPVRADGTNVVVASGTVIDTGTVGGNAGIGLSASNGGTIVADGPISLRTGGGSAHAVLSSGNASLIRLIGGDITTGNAYALWADAGGRVEASDLTVNTGGTAILSQGAGSHLSLARSTITTSGFGLHAFNSSTLDATDVVVASLNAWGVEANTQSVITLATTATGQNTVTTLGNGHVGLLAQNNGAILSTGLLNVGTVGTSSHGAHARAGGLMDLATADLTTTGAGADGVRADGGTARLASSSVTTDGVAATGLHALNGGTVTGVQTTVRTGNDGAHAVYAEGSQSRIDLQDGVLAAKGVGSAGALAANDAEVSLTGLDVTSRNDGSNVGLRVAAGGTVAMSNGQLSTSGHAVLAEGPGVAVVALDHVDATTNDGMLARAASGSALQLSAAASTLRGDLGIDDADAGTTTASATFADNVQWTGAAKGFNAVSLTDSAWRMTADSRVGRLQVANSSVNFDHADGAFKTLTVEGDYHGEGALLAMNTVLGADDSLTDRLHVTGNTSGDTALAVNNVGGRGDYTANGILLVQVDGRSDGTFSQSGRVVGGQYEYFLHKGGRVTGEDGNWYLRSELPEIAPVDPVDPVGPVGPVDPVDPADPVEPADPIAPVDPVGPIDPVEPSDPVTVPVEPVIEPVIDPVTPVVEPIADPAPPLPLPAPVLRPEVGAYLANRAAATGMFQMTLHERMGEPELVTRAQDTRGGNAWARVTGEQVDQTMAGQFDIDRDASALQIGADMARWGTESRGLFGVMLGMGQSKAVSTSDITGYAAVGKVRGNALGLYGTWYQHAEKNDGLYLDAWLQYGRFQNTVQGDGLQTERYRSFTGTASLEAGYAVALQRTDTRVLYIEPQLQIIANRYGVIGGQHAEHTGTQVEADATAGITTRVGVRAYGHALAEGNRVQPFVAVNWWRNSGHADGMVFDGEQVNGSAPRDIGEVKVGAQVRMSRHLSGWGEMKVQRGSQNFGNVGAQLGLKYSW